jgi:probable rRNA maturation factor
LPIPRRRLRQLLTALLASEGAPEEGELSLVFCEDDFIHALNRHYRGKDRPTDVLSFPQGPESGVLGDLVISVPAAQRQARERGHSRETELEWLFLHGLLHLLGHDDETEAQAEEMNERARRALVLADRAAP